MPNESLNLNLLLRPFRPAWKKPNEDEPTTNKYREKKRSNIVQNFSRAAKNIRYAKERRSSDRLRFARTLKSFEDRCAFPCVRLITNRRKTGNKVQETNPSSIHSRAPLHASIHRAIGGYRPQQMSCLAVSLHFDTHRCYRAG